MSHTNLILAHFTAFYRILRHVTAFYRILLPFPAVFGRFLVVFGRFSPVFARFRSFSGVFNRFHTFSDDFQAFSDGFWLIFAQFSADFVGPRKKNPKFSIFAAGEPPAAEAAATAKIENFAGKTKENARKRKCDKKSFQ